MARKTNLERESRYRGLINGLRARATPDETWVVAGESYTVAQMIALLQSMIDGMAETASLYAQWSAQVAKQGALERKLRGFVRFIEFNVRLKYGEKARPLADFGLAPTKKTGPRTVAVKVAMAQKARATRALRGTMGKRQRKKIKRAKA